MRWGFVLAWAIGVVSNLLAGEVAVDRDWLAKVGNSEDVAFQDCLAMACGRLGERSKEVRAGGHGARMNVTWLDREAAQQFVARLRPGCTLLDCSDRGIAYLLDAVKKGGVGIVQVLGRRHVGSIEDKESLLIEYAESDDMFTVTDQVGREGLMRGPECADQLLGLKTGRRFCLIEGGDRGAGRSGRVPPAIRTGGLKCAAMSGDGNDRVIGIPGGGTVYLGTVGVSDGIREFKFGVSNCLGRAVSIAEVKGECSCFKGGRSSGRLEPGERGECVVSFDLGAIPNRMNGYIGRVVLVLDDQEVAAVAVRVRFGITPERGLLIDPTCVDLGVVREGEERPGPFSVDALIGRFDLDRDVELVYEPDGPGVTCVGEEGEMMGRPVGDRLMLLRRYWFGVNLGAIEPGSNFGEILFMRKDARDVMARLRWKLYYVGTKKTAGER